MSYDFGWSGSAKQRPLVIWTWWFANLAFPSSEEGASILMNNSDKDRVLFKNISGSGQTCGGGTLNATEVAEINAYCKDLIDTWFNEKGLLLFVTTVRVQEINSTSIFCVPIRKPLRKVECG